MLFASAFTLLSCNKIIEDNPVPEGIEDGSFLTINLDCESTKSTGQTKSNEDALNNVSVFVFRTETGAKLDASSYVDLSPANTGAGSGTPYSVTLKCTTGNRKVYVVANASSDLTKTIKCEADLLSNSTLLKDNGLKSFFMMGSANISVSGSECSASVKLTRFVSSVRIEKITNLMEAEAYRADGLFVLNAIYLTNVVGKMNLDGSNMPSTLGSSFWHAKLSAEENPLFYDGGINAGVKYGDANARAVAHTFYAFPNDCAINESSTWSQRSTMLVVEATLDGAKYYYPVAVGPLESNKQYVITNFTVRRPGSTNPWESIHKSDATIDIEVVPWGTPVTTTEDL